MLKKFLLATVVLCICSTSGFAQTTVTFNNADGLDFDNSIFNDASAIIGGETVDDFSFAAKHRSQYDQL